MRESRCITAWSKLAGCRKRCALFCCSIREKIVHLLRFSQSTTENPDGLLCEVKIEEEDSKSEYLVEANYKLPGT